MIDEIVIDEDLEKSDTEIETYESINEFEFPQEYEDGVVITLDDSNGKETNDPRIQSMFKRSRHNYLSIFIINQHYYELPKKLSKQMVISITSQNQTTTEMFKISSKKKQPW